MLSEYMKRSVRDDLEEQLTGARRELKRQQQRLAQLKYEWNIAKRLRSQAPNEEEREQWRVQSDAYLGLVMQQEGVIEEIEESIARHRSMLAELDVSKTSETERQV
jgi:hypothetical protein